jgi:ribosomal protein S4E
MKEAKKILTSRSVYVDGKIVTESKSPIGFMDVITAGENSWRILFDTKGRLMTKVTKNDKVKVCRVEKKTRIKRGKIQFTLHDGKTLADGKGSVGDCLLISLPEGKVTKTYTFETKMSCLIIGGKHVGKKAVIEEIIPGTATRSSQVKCNIDGTISTTLKSYIFPIGDFKLE